MKVRYLLIGVVVLFVVGFLFVVPSEAKIDSKSIVGMWLLDEGSGAVTKDSSGNDNDGKLIGSPAWVQGKFGKALEFNGTDNYVSIANSPIFNFVNVDFSASFWMNAKSWDNPISDARTMIDFETGGWNGWLVRYSEGTGTITLGGGGNERTALTIVPSLDQWHHVTVTYSEGGSEIKGYLDGKLDKTTSINLNLTNSTTAHGIGTNPENVGQAFDGIIDEVAVFNVVLEEGDIQNIVNQGLERALGVTAVSQSGKLAATWASIKAQ